MGKMLRIAAALLFLASTARAASWPTSTARTGSTRRRRTSDRGRARRSGRRSRPGGPRTRSRALLVEARSHARAPNATSSRISSSRASRPRTNGSGSRRHPGSRTARGFVFIVFGSPARVRDEPTRPRRRADVSAAARRSHRGQRDDHALDLRPGAHAAGSRRARPLARSRSRSSSSRSGIPTPSRARGSSRSCGRSSRRRRSSIRTLVPAAVAAATSAAEAALRRPPRRPGPGAGFPRPQPLRRRALDSAVRPLLDQAPFSRGRGTPSSATPCSGATPAGRETLLWLSAVPPGGRRREASRSRASSARRTAETRSRRSPTRRVRPTRFRARRRATSTSARSICPRDPTRPRRGDGRPAARRSPSAGAKLLGAGSLVGIRRLADSALPDAAAALAAQNEGSPFAIGQGVLPPRADATFATSESLWFYVEMANAPDPAKVTLELRLRQGNAAVRTPGRPFPVQFTSVGPNRVHRGVRDLRSRRSRRATTGSTCSSATASRRRTSTSCARRTSGSAEGAAPGGGVPLSTRCGRRRGRCPSCPSPCRAR